MLLGIPLLQIVLFGFAIQLTTRTLSASLVTDNSADTAVALRVEHILEPARFDIRSTLEDAKHGMARGATNLIVDVTQHPPVVYIDASNPIEATISELRMEKVLHSLAAPLETEDARPERPIRIERLYHSSMATQPYLLTGLLGAIPTMSLVMMGALTVARERERRTLDVLKASPAGFAETACGKLLPYMALGLIQCTLIILVMRFVFQLGFNGLGWSLAGATVVFALANLTLGLLFSYLAGQQLQAAQLTFFYFLPSSLLSGFMFPFTAMPIWAQRVGELLPMTHYLRITRSVMLRGVDPGFVIAEILPILAFASVASLGAYGLWRYDRHDQ
jgi:ABC-2 type transport system permease protein